MTHPENPFEDVNWQKIPDRCRAGLLAHFREGREVGSFLTAVLSNDLCTACLKADEENLPLLKEYMRILFEFAPGGSWGSPEAVSYWRSVGGLAGIEKREKG